MKNRIKKYNLEIDGKFFDFINNKVLPGTQIGKDDFWNNFSKLIYDFGPINKQLLKKREIIQQQLDKWHKDHIGKEYNLKEYKKYLVNIGYLVKEGDDFAIDTANVDPEIATISGPQLVVPITNARYAINAVNARWGSLYDALYGTDVIGGLPESNTYNTIRGEKVIKYAKSHLDKIAPLKQASWKQIIEIRLEDKEVKFFLSQYSFTTLENKNQIVGLRLNTNHKINELVLMKNNLNCRIIIDPDNPIGKMDPAKISDIILESAVSAILDCEDSVSTVDAEDKILAYQNWLGLMKGNLIAEFIKNKKKISRVLNKDIELITLNGRKKILKGRALMLIRNVGHLMTTPTILDKNKNEIEEGLMDAVITTLIALHDLNKKEGNRNSLHNSIYIVKPKMHGPQEVSFTTHLFSRVEKMLNLPENTLKVGIMDEERRTSANLKECIRAAKSRVAFINTGFLDRTGDEIHSSMQSGAFVRKGDMKNSTWIKAYEDRNVDIGLLCGLKGKAQIGKGMWAMPDRMSQMIEQKIEHPQAGANCSWVPSPTAATLHAMHYHNVDVNNVQNELVKKGLRGTLEDLLTIPLLNRKNLSEEEINAEIENNTHGILGYVVRWIDQGIGCSKVPDINNISLMEDRATCRISSQALANWLEHEIITKEQVLNAFKKMAVVVDKQNAHDPNYIPMSPSFNTTAFKAAKNLVFEGLIQPSGYTEPILHKRRLEFKLLNIYNNNK